VRATRSVARIIEVRMSGVTSITDDQQIILLIRAHFTS
jgi:hypothetical protein